MIENTTTFSLTEPFALKKNEDDSVSLTGFAIHGGTDDDPLIVNGLFKVPEDEMKNCMDSIQGSKLMKDHDHEHVDSIIGKVETAAIQVDPANNRQGVTYQAQMMFDDTNLQQKIEKGLIDATSIGFEFTPWCDQCGKEFDMWECEHWYTDEDFAITTKDMKIKELSLVVFGADPHATVGAMSADDYKIEFNKMKEEFIMAKQKDNEFSELKEENIELKQQVQDLEAKLSKKDEEFKSQKEDLLLSHQEEVLTLKTEKDALEGKMSEMQEELAIFRAEEAERKEAALSAKREKLVSLAKELKVEDTVEDCESFSEDYIDKQIAVFERVIESRPAVVSQYKEEQNDKLVKDEEPVEREAFSNVANIFYNSPSLGTR